MILSYNKSMSLDSLILERKEEIRIFLKVTIFFFFNIISEQRNRNLDQGKCVVITFYKKLSSQWNKI